MDCWTAGDRNDLEMFRQISRRSSRGSVSGSMDLPVISEPSSGESSSSEDEEKDVNVEKSVKSEVERLVRFNNRRGTIGCDGDVKMFKEMMNMKMR